MNAIERTLDELAKTSADTLYDRALALRQGDGVRVNFRAAHRFFLLASLMGRPAARYQLAQMHLRGEDRPKDKLRAAMWMHLAMGRDDPRAARSLRQIIDEMSRAEQKQVFRQAEEFVKAEQEFLLALKGGDPAAMVAIGERLATGRGVDRDPEMASEWYRRALVFRYPPAQTRLGLAYLNGEGVERHLEEGQRLLRLAAGQHDANAQYHLGESLRQQLSGRAEGVKLLEQAAAQGHSLAQCCLGKLYKEGEVLPAGAVGVHRDVAPHLVRAREYLEQAATQGMVDAQFELGQMHAQGQGTRQDFEQAARYYLDAANQGHAKAQFNLGFLYAHGQGVEQDDARAYQWYRISERSGYTLAAQSAALAQKKLSEETKEMADWRVDGFLGGHLD
jgi:TPR repeat protein